jgi:3-methyladenine DNA glycosylase AlkD
MQYREIIKKLKSLSNPKNVVGMAKFGINPHNTLGISIYVLRNIAKEIKKIISSPNSYGIQKFTKLGFLPDLLTSQIK